MIRSRLRGAQAHAESPGRRSGKLKYGAAPVATQILLHLLLHPSPSFHTLLMTDDARYLVRQFETAWKLASYHLDGLTTKECLWRPAPEGLHVHQVPDGRWRADWPDREGYDIGPPSIAWLTWHIGFWWSTVLDRSFGEGTLSRESVMWPGAADGVRAWLGGLQEQWRKVLEQTRDDDLRSMQRTRWPFQGRPFGDVIAWVNVELTKNAAEIGYARFLYAVSVGNEDAGARR
jgi:hypothetical protein